MVRSFKNRLNLATFFSGDPQSYFQRFYKIGDRPTVIGRPNKQPVSYQKKWDAESRLN